MTFGSLPRLLFLFILLAQGTLCLTQKCGSAARCILGQQVGGWEEEVDQQGQMGPTVPL